MKIIGLHGPSGSGKSTVAHFLVTQYHFVPMAFADYFKIPAVALDGVVREQVFGPEAKNAVTRNLLQLRGTEQGRDIYGTEVWVHHLAAHLYRLRQMGVGRVVIDDVRFGNEADFIASQGGEVWALLGRGGLSGAAAKHRSEMPLDPPGIAWNLHNHGTISDIQSAIASYVRTIHHLTSNAELESYAE